MSDYSEDSTSGSDAPAPVEDDDARLWKAHLLQCLDGIKSAGDIAVLNRYTAFTNPGIQIEGTRTIPLPLPPSDAEAIRDACKQAPFGKGGQTVVGTSVRNTWELDCDQFQLANPEWEPYFSQIIQDAAKGLGLLDVTAHLHKLLLYEEGSFLKRHEDSEKEDGMVGTLVVCLPSRHVGGEVCLSFRSEKRTLATEPASEWDMTALAWFSDVTHEATKLAQGYRLALTYKLIQPGSIQQSAQFFHQQSQSLRSILLDWEARAHLASVLFYRLDHRYPETSLSIHNMKGRDRAVCKFLHETCSDCGIFLLLGQMTRTERGEEVDYSYKHETFLNLRTMHSVDGKVIGADFDVKGHEILGADIFDRDPDGEDKAEFTGDEDALAYFHRHDTVAMLVPKQHLGRYLKQSFYSAAESRYADNMVSMVHQDLQEHGDAATKSSALALFKKVLEELGTCTASTAQTATHWAVELGDDELYGAMLSCASCNSLAREGVLRTICRHIEGRHADQAKTIEWGAWLEDLAESCSLESWQLILDQFPGYLESKHLQDSFKLWGQARLDQKFDSRAEWCSGDHNFLIKSIESRHADSEWVMARLLPALASRGRRDLLYKILKTLFERREQEQSSIVRIAFSYLFEHSISTLLIGEADLRKGRYSEYTPAGPVREFVTLLDQSLTIGPGEHAMRLLEATYNGLAGDMPVMELCRDG